MNISKDVTFMAKLAKMSSESARTESSDAASGRGRQMVRLLVFTRSWSLNE